LKTYGLDEYGDQGIFEVRILLEEPLVITEDAQIISHLSKHPGDIF